MARITYIQHDGARRVVEVPAGQTVMEGAVWNRVPGILADCGGDGGCATCHVYVDQSWVAKTGQPSRSEKSTLRFALGVEHNSRLACQIPVTDELDGLVVRMPVRQF